MKYLILAVLFSGCASLSSKIYNEIHVGDSVNHVKDTLGDPDGFGPSSRVENAQVWFYDHKKDSCGITIKDDKVVNSFCDKNKNYNNSGSAVGEILKGMGDGLKSSNGDSVHCTSSTMGNMTDTNCN